MTTGVGKTGVVGLLRNGDGPDGHAARRHGRAAGARKPPACPMRARSRRRIASGKTVPVMHACGHDMHVAWLVGAATLFAQARDAWHGTLMAVFQPAKRRPKARRR